MGGKSGDGFDVCVLCLNVGAFCSRRLFVELWLIGSWSVSVFDYRFSLVDLTDC